MVDLNDFREAVTTFSLGLGEPEVVAFFKGFDADGSGGIDFEVGFCASKVFSNSQFIFLPCVNNRTALSVVTCTRTR